MLESYHATLPRLIKVSHPNPCAFLGHLQNITVDNMSDWCVYVMVSRSVVRRSRRTCGNESRIKACLSRFNNGTLQFLRASESHTAQSRRCQLGRRRGYAAGANEQRLLAASPQRRSHQRQMTRRLNRCDVCLTAPIDGFALVPRMWPHQILRNYAGIVADMGRNCPMCGSSIWLWAYLRKLEPEHKNIVI